MTEDYKPYAIRKKEAREGQALSSASQCSGPNGALETLTAIVAAL